MPKKPKKIEEEDSIIPPKKPTKEEKEMEEVKKEIQKEDKEIKSEGSGYNMFFAVVSIAVIVAFAMYYLLTSLGGIEIIEEAEEEKEVLTILYSEQLSQEDSGGRGYPTLRIMKKVGDEEAVVLVDKIGGVGEYPNFFRLSPDKSKLFASLESKLVAIDLENGDYEEVFVPNKQVMDVDFFDDGKMLIWDQIYASQDYEYFVHEYDLDSGDVELLHSGDAKDKYLFLGGKNGDELFLNQALGEASAPWKMNLKNGELEQIADPALFVSFSKTGKYLTIPDKDLTDICNDFMGSSVSTFAVANVSNGELVTSFGKEDVGLANFWLKPDDSEVLFSTKPVMKDRDGEEYEDRMNRCTRFVPKETYYKQKIEAGSEAELVENPDDIYEEWNPGELRITGGKDDTGQKWVYFYRGEIVFDPVAASLISVYK